MMKQTSEWDLHRKELGKRGEEIASDFLMQRGMTVLERNARSGHKELDIICTEASRSGLSLRFIEVKTRREPVQGEPWEAVNRKKQQNLVKAAKAYLASEKYKSHHIFCDEIFFDIVTIVWNQEGTAYSLNYIPDAFRPVYA